MGPIVMQFHREGGMAGFCDEMTIRSGGTIEYHTCGRPTQTAMLTLDERQELQQWVSDFSGFVVTREDNPGGPDNLVRRLEFTGTGQASAPDDRRQTMLRWAEQVYSDLREEPVPGSPVSTAGTVLDVLDQQVIVILPEEPGHDLIAVTPQTTFSFLDGKPASLSDVQPGVRIEAQGKAVGSGGMEAEAIVIQKPDP